MSDEWPSYTSLPKYGYERGVINHKAREFRKGEVYTQNIEFVWSTFKRGLIGMYRQVGKKYLQAYADEYAFRYNNRKAPALMFDVLLSHVAEVRAVK